MLTYEIFKKIVEDLQRKAQNNKEREVYLNLREYGLKINQETIEEILAYLKEESIIETGIVDGKGLIRCIVCKF